MDDAILAALHHTLVTDADHAWALKVFLAWVKDRNPVIGDAQQYFDAWTAGYEYGVEVAY